MIQDVHPRLSSLTSSDGTAGAGLGEVSGRLPYPTKVQAPGTTLNFT